MKQTNQQKKERKKEVLSDKNDLEDKSEKHSKRKIDRLKFKNKYKEIVS